MNADTTTIRLSIKRGKTTEEVLDLSGPDIPIGRNPDARVSFDDDGNQGVSWDHATIRLDQTGVFVADAGSTNGTYLNGTKVEKQVPLHEHDIIRLGAQGPEIQILKISVPPAAEAAAWRPSDRQSPSTAGPAKPARQVAAAAAVSDVAREDKPSKAHKDQERKSESTPDVRFGNYVVRHFGQTKGAFAFGICLAILAAPILSLFKARLLVVGVWAALGLLAAFCFACGFAYLAGRWLSFYLLRRRSVSENSRSLTAKAFYTTAIATILLFPIPIIESFSSEQGMLVTLVPQLADFQSKPGAPPDPVPPEPDPPPPVPVPPEPEPKPTPPELVPPALEPKPSPPVPVPPEPEPKPSPPEPGPPEPKPQVPPDYLAEGAHFVMVNPQHFAVVIRQDDLGQFRNVFETADDDPPLPAAAQGLQRVGVDPSLTRQIFDRTDPGQQVPQDLSTRIGMYWRPQQFLPPGLSRGAEFVAFKDLKQDKYLVGLLAESDDSELDFFTLDHGSVCRDRKLILAGTAVRGQGHDFAATVCEMDFLHYVLLNVIRHLDSNEEKCGYSLLAVRVDTRRLDEQLEEFTRAESDSMDNLERMKSIAAGPPGTSRSIEGRGILGTLLAFSYMNEERRAENSLTSPFLQELQSVHTVREAASRLLQFLKDQANWIEDEIYRILTQRNVTVLERARLDQVLKERRLSTTEEFEPTDLVRLLTATHLLTVELGPAREGGTYHVTATLVECSSARKLWTEDRDRFVPVPGSLVTASGAFLFNTGPLAKLYTSAEATKVKLVHIDRHDPASMLRYREVFGGDTRELRGAAASFGYITGDADVPPPLVPKYLAWRIAYATMPIACPVTSAHGSVGTIWVGDNKTVKPDVKLTVYRNASKTTPSAGHSIQRPLATTATVTKRTQNAAEIVLSAPGVNYVWPDECTLVEGDFVVSVGGQTPLIAAVGIDFLGLDQNLAQALQIGNVLQRNRIDGERRDRMKVISDEVKQQLLDAGIAFIEAEGPDPATRMQDARRRGATHIVRGSCSFTKKRSEYELIMKLQRIDKEGVHAEVKVTVK